MPSRKANDSGDDRLMTLAEVARYLHLGERTVAKLAKAKKIPAALIDNQWRFRRAALDEWLERQAGGDEDEGFESIEDGMRVPLGDVLTSESVILDLRAGDAFGVIEELAARAYAQRWLHDKPWFVGAVVERESLASTAMEGGVAFLHTRAKDHGKIAQPFIVVGRSYQGIDFGAPDGQPTYLFFLLGLKHDKLHLPILGRLARALRDPRTVAKLRATTSATAMRNTLLGADEKALAGRLQQPPKFPPAPQLDLEVRKRAIMRMAKRREEEARQQQAARRATSRSSRPAKPAKGAGGKGTPGPRKTGGKGPKK